MRRLQFAIIALVATSVGASVCATPTLAKPPVKKHSAKKPTMKKSSSKKMSAAARRRRNGCPPVIRTKRHTPVTPRGGKTIIIKTPPVTNTIIREVVKKVTIDQETLDKLKAEIIAGIKFPDIPEAKVDLSKIEAQIALLMECCKTMEENYKKDKTFDLRRTAHFEEQLCDILTLVKKQQECIEELCKKNGTRSMAPVMAPAMMGGGAAIKPAKISIGRDIDGDMFNGDKFRVQTGYDLGKVPVIGDVLGGPSTLQIYADHFEVGTPTTGAGLAGRFYTSDSGKVRLYAGGGAGVYTTNFARGGAHQTENGGKVFVGLETNRRSYLEFNVTSVQNYGPASRTAKVYFGQRF